MPKGSILGLLLLIILFNDLIDVIHMPSSLHYFTGNNGSLKGLRTPDGIAYDWLTEKIYWTDAQENTISRVSVLKNTTREVIMTEDLDEPRAIVVSPCDG